MKSFCVLGEMELFDAPVSLCYIVEASFSKGDLLSAQPPPPSPSLRLSFCPKPGKDWISEMSRHLGSDRDVNWGFCFPITWAEGGSHCRGRESVECSIETLRPYIISQIWLFLTTVSFSFLLRNILFSLLGTLSEKRYSSDRCFTNI